MGDEGGSCSRAGQGGNGLNPAVLHAWGLPPELAINAVYETRRHLLPMLQAFPGLLKERFGAGGIEKLSSRNVLAPGEARIGSRGQASASYLASSAASARDQRCPASFCARCMAWMAPTLSSRANAQAARRRIRS